MKGIVFGYFIYHHMSHFTVSVLSHLNFFLFSFFRSQRLAMLDSNTFIKRLLGVVCLDGPDKTQPAQGLALDILSWVVSVRLSPHCSGGSGIGDARLLQQQLEVGRIIKSHIMELIHHCFILGGRSIAHKCLKFILVCIK